MNERLSQPSGWVSLLVALVASGCTRSCARDKPYVPYHVSDSSSAASPSSLPSPRPSASAAAKTMFPRQARRLDSLPQTIQIAGRSFDAPSNTRFQWILEGDVDGDSHPDVYAWVIEGPQHQGQLLQLFSSTHPNAPGKLIYRTPTVLIHRDCMQNARLSQVGPQTLQVEQACHGPGDAPSRRWLTVLAPTQQTMERMQFVLSPVSQGTRLNVAVQAGDRDNDGRDDVTAAFSIDMDAGTFDESSAGKIELKVMYLDRPAGLSLDQQEPSRTLRLLADRVRIMAASKVRRREVPAFSRQLRVLYAAVCAESGMSVVQANSAALPCHAPHFLDKVAAYSANAYLASKQPTEALGQLGLVSSLNDEMKPSSKPLAKIMRATLKSWSKQVPSVKATSYYLPFGASRYPDHRLQWGGLAFDKQGNLRIMTDVATVVIDPRTRLPVSTPNGQERKSWSLSLTPPTNQATTMTVRNACAPGLLAIVRGEGTKPARTLLPIASILAPCATKHARGDANQPTGQLVAAQVLGNKAERYQLLVRGIPVWVDLTTGKSAAALSTTSSLHPGSAWSPDGHASAIPSRFGILVQHAGHAQMWQAKLPTGTMADLGSCTVSNDATVVACSNLRRRRTRLFLKAHE